MKRWYPALILLCLLLAGCSGKGEETTFPTQTEAVPVEAAPPAGLHDPDDPVEVRYGDALRAYPLSAANVAGMKVMGSDLLVFSDTEVSTRITRLSGEELYIAATARLDFGLTPDNPSLQVTESGLSYFDPVNRQTVVLDASLREITHIPVPEDLEGTPLLSRDRETLYYCTKAGVRAWNLETGIRRIIKEAGFAQQSVTGLHLNDTVLQCRVADNEGNASTLLLSTESGRILYEGAQELTMRSRGDSYFISFPTGCTRALLFGQAGEEAPLALTPAELSGEDFLLETFADAVTASVASDTEIKLDYYDLETGRRRSSVTLPFFGLPLTVEDLVGETAYTDYSCCRAVEGTPLMTAHKYWQEVPYVFDIVSEEDGPELLYEIYEVKLDCLYEPVKQSFFKDKTFSIPGKFKFAVSQNWTPVDAAPWGALDAYRFIREDNTPIGNFLLCYADRFVEIRFDPWYDGAAPTEKQMALVGTVLGSGPLS